MPLRSSSLALFALVATPALAQAPAQTGTGAGPNSAITAPNTSSVGRTMPPSRGEGGASNSAMERETSMERKDDKIDSGICIGCNK